MIECQNHDSCINDSIAQAELICNEKNIRFTDLRKKVFLIILQNHQPAKAYDVLDQLQKDDASAKPSTVYRTLDFLMENGIIHKLHSSNSYVACSHPEKHNRCYFLICNNCNEIKECCDENLTKAVNDVTDGLHFEAQNTIIEISGVCEVCR